MPTNQKTYETLLLILMILAVLFSIIFFGYKTWGPTDEKPKYVSTKTTTTSSNEEEKNTPKVISSEELKTKIDKNENILLLDVQNRENFATKHLPNAINIPAEELTDRKDELPKDKEIIVMASGEKIDKCQMCQRAAESLISFGLPNILHYKEGVAGWEEKGLPIILGTATTYKNINAQQLKQKIDDKENIFVVDLRSEEEYNQKHIKGAVFMPFEGILAKIDELPRDKEIIFYDKTGERSKLVVEQLVKNGLINATNLIEGFRIWEEKDYPTAK